MHVYARVNNKMAVWTVDTLDPAIAIETVKETLPESFTGAVLAVVK